VETTRRDLLHNATATVRRGGSSALNFRDLGRSVGVKSSTVHYYFPTKADLLTEIAGEYTRTFVEALEDGISGSPSFKHDMLALVDLFVSAQGQKLACLCGMLATEANQLEPNVTNAVNQFFKTLQDWIVRRIRVREAVAPGGLAPAAFARLLVSMLEGALLLSRMPAHESSLAAARQWIAKAI
jgi:TetR/AcrR family transcriptional regulator, transcriptional repressor for nem operon